MHHLGIKVLSFQGKSYFIGLPPEQSKYLIDKSGQKFIFFQKTE